VIPCTAVARHTNVLEKEAALKIKDSKIVGNVE
jgi:hypothetical protein